MKIVQFMEDGIESEATVNDMISIESLISIAISIEHNKTIACFWFVDLQMFAWKLFKLVLPSGDQPWFFGIK